MFPLLNRFLPNDRASQSREHVHALPLAPRRSPSSRWPPPPARRAPQQYFESGNKYFDQQKYQEAVVEYRNAIQKDPKLRRRAAQAGRDLRPGWATSAERVPGVRPRGRPAARTTSTRSSRPATTCFRAGQYEDAAARADDVLKKDPRNVNALILKGNIAAGAAGPGRRAEADRGSHQDRSEAEPRLHEPRLPSRR